MSGNDKRWSLGKGFSRMDWDPIKEGDIEVVENKMTSEFEQFRRTKQWSRMRFLLEKMFPKEYLWAHAPYVAFQVAASKGLITKEEHEEARRSYGSMWNYAGD